MHFRFVMFALILAVFGLASARAQKLDDSSLASATATTQPFTTGWDKFGEPLNLAKSSVKWTPATHKLTLTYKLVGATPSKLYQVAINFFCDTFPATFGQFPVDGGGGTCFTLTRQGVTKTAAEVEVGVVTTDLHGNGSVTVAIIGVTPGTYQAEFYVRDGAGCNLIGGGGSSGCNVDFQSPGPWGTASTVTIP
jgi:hypothetical protein